MPAAIKANMLTCVLVLVVIGVVLGVSGCGLAAYQQVSSAAAQNTTTAASTVAPNTTPPSSASNNGHITVTVDASHYGATDTIGVAINNTSGGDISAPDHQTNCMEVTLLRSVNGAWEPERQCRLLSPTRLVALAPGATPQPLAPGSTPWPVGIYRIAFAYFIGADSATPSGSGAGTVGTPGQDDPVYSTTFTVG